MKSLQIQIRTLHGYGVELVSVVVKTKREMQAEIQRLNKLLEENEKLMMEAAIQTETLTKAVSVKLRTRKSKSN